MSQNNLKNNLKSAATLREPAELVAHGLAAAADLSDLERVAARYAVAVTSDVAALIDANDPDDPIARQFVPRVGELVAGRGKATALPQAAYRDALDYIRARKEIWEVILTGGDPLMLSARRLSEVMAD